MRQWRKKSKKPSFPYKMWNSKVAMIFENFDCIWKLCTRSSRRIQGRIKIGTGTCRNLLITEQVAYPQDTKAWKFPNYRVKLFGCRCEYDHYSVIAVLIFCLKFVWNINLRRGIRAPEDPPLAIHLLWENHTFEL